MNSDLETLLSNIAITAAQRTEPVGAASGPLGIGNNLSNLLYSPPRASLDQRSSGLTPMIPSCTSLYVKNLPPEADRLWMYER